MRDYAKEELKKILESHGKALIYYTKETRDKILANMILARRIDGIRENFRLCTVGAFTFSGNSASAGVLLKNCFREVENFTEDGRESKLDFPEPIGFSCTELRTERLSLRPVGDGDREAFRTILSDAEATVPAGFLPPTGDAFEEFFEGLKKPKTALSILTGKTPIGYVRVYEERLDEEEFKEKRVAGLGFLIGKEYWNRGYGTEMLKAVTAYLKERCDFCMADHFVENGASRRIIEKCGYRFYEEYDMVFEHLGDEPKHLRSYIY